RSQRGRPGSQNREDEARRVSSRTPTLPVPLQVSLRTTDTPRMATHGRIILLVFVVLLAGCAQDDNAAGTSVAPSTSSTTTAAPAMDATTTPTAPTTTTTEPPTMTTAPTTTSTDPESTTIGFDPDQVLPGSFGTVGDLMSLSDMYNIDPLDAQILSSFAIDGDEEVLANRGMEAGVLESLTITYSGDITVWDFGGGYREVLRGDESFYLDEDGTWHENDRWEWPGMGPFYEWTFVQGIAPGCLEFRAEIIGLEDVAGATTLHVRCTWDEGDPEGTGSSDVWIGEQGHVMKSVSESWQDPSFGFITVWEVTGLDVQPTGPLPPGW
ncbi:MAG: hypothetical protein WBO84_12245, partial [Acidimicrobiia bacterium]